MVIVRYQRGSSAIQNLAPTAIADSTAIFNASLSALGTNRDVTVYYGTSDGGTNASAWGTSTYVGSWTNVSTNISHAVSGLTAVTTYHYTFMASNATTNVWASPSWTFRTSPLIVTTNHSVPYTWLGNWTWTNACESAVLGDEDNDGFSTWQEYWSGTDPQNSNSFLRIDYIGYSGTDIVIRWQNAAVETALPPLAIQATTNLVSGSWSNVGQKAIINGVNAWSNAGSQQIFYRLAVTNAP